MPYIKEEARYRLMAEMGGDADRGIVRLPRPQNAGELNYIITRIILDYSHRKGGDYQAWNDVTGALENAKMEAYRRHVAPYEDKKIEENGDV